VSGEVELSVLVIIRYDETKCLLADPSFPTAHYAVIYVIKDIITDRNGMKMG